MLRRNRYSCRILKEDLVPIVLSTITAASLVMHVVFERVKITEQMVLYHHPRLSLLEVPAVMATLRPRRMEIQIYHFQDLYNFLSSISVKKRNLEFGVCGL